MYKNYNKKQDQLAEASENFIPLRSHHEYSDYRDHQILLLYLLLYATTHKLKP